MSTLKHQDRILLERFLEMGSGYVCDFSDRTFADFVVESVNVDVYTAEYTEQGTSKAKRLRMFWKNESNYRTAKLLKDMLAYWRRQKEVADADLNRALFDNCWDIVTRLEAESPVEDLSVFSENSGAVNFEHLADAIQQSIEAGTPEIALDRLHTYVVKYVRERCDVLGVGYAKDTPLHSLFGGYLKVLRRRGVVESEMTERILTSTISVLEAFNDVRNNRSLAHDNDLLKRAESTLIFRHVSNVLRFLQSADTLPGE